MNLSLWMCLLWLPNVFQTGLILGFMSSVFSRSYYEIILLCMSLENFISVCELLKFGKNRQKYYKVILLLSRGVS